MKACCVCMYTVIVDNKCGFSHECMLRDKKIYSAHPRSEFSKDTLPEKSVSGREVTNLFFQREFVNSSLTQIEGASPCFGTEYHIETVPETHHRRHRFSA